MAHALIQIECPHCRARFKVQQKFVSCKANCKDCGRSFTIGALAGPSNAPQSPALAGTPEPEQHPTSQTSHGSDVTVNQEVLGARPRTRRVRFWIIASLGGAALAALGLVFSLSLLPRGTDVNRLDGAYLIEFESEAFGLSRGHSGPMTVCVVYLENAMPGEAAKVRVGLRGDGGLFTPMGIKWKDYGYPDWMNLCFAEFMTVDTESGSRHGTQLFIFLEDFNWVDDNRVRILVPDVIRDQIGFRYYGRARVWMGTGRPAKGCMSEEGAFEVELNFSHP